MRLRVTGIVCIALTAWIVSPCAQEVTLAPLGTTYGRAQIVVWLNHDRFAVGRWDGSLTIFRPPVNKERGPMLVQDGAVPSLQAIQMITALSPTSFVTSNDERSLALWVEQNGLSRPVQHLEYSSELGVANSGVTFNSGGKTWLVTGHEQGYVAIWELRAEKPVFIRAVSLRSPSPVSSPYRLWNIRGVAFWKNGIIVTGSEDGDLALLRIPEGVVLSRTRFNQSALRGINSISVRGDYLVVANCSVGPSDKNMWLYRIDQDHIVPLDSANLEKQTSRPQVYNFGVELISLNKSIYFLASTEEGLIWIGTIDGNHLKVYGDTEVAPLTGGAAAIATRDDGEVAAAALDIELLKVQFQNAPSIRPFGSGFLDSKRDSAQK